MDPLHVELGADPEFLMAREDLSKSMFGWRHSLFLLFVIVGVQGSCRPLEQYSLANRVFLRFGCEKFPIFMRGNPRLSRSPTHPAVGFAVKLCT